MWISPIKSVEIEKRKREIEEDRKRERDSESSLFAKIARMMWHHLNAIVKSVYRINAHQIEIVYNGNVSRRWRNVQKKIISKQQIAVCISNNLKIRCFNAMFTLPYIYAKSHAVSYAWLKSIAPFDIICTCDCRYFQWSSKFAECSQVFMILPWNSLLVKSHHLANKCVYAYWNHENLTLNLSWHSVDRLLIHPIGYSRFFLNWMHFKQGINTSNLSF